MTKTAIEPPHFPFFDYTHYTFSLGLETPEGIWLSGHTASRYDPGRNRMVVEGDILQQSRAAYERIGTILQAAGLGFKDVVRTVDDVTVKGIQDYASTAELRREIFGDAPPATSVVVVDSLLRPEALIEIEVVASRREHAAVDPGWPASPVPGSVAGGGRRPLHLRPVAAQAGHWRHRGSGRHCCPGPPDLRQRRGDLGCRWPGVGERGQDGGLPSARGSAGVQGNGRCA